MANRSKTTRHNTSKVREQQSRSEKQPASGSWRDRIAAIVGYSAWIVAVFVASQLLLVVILNLLESMGLYTYDGSDTIVTLMIGSVTYALMLAMTVGIPRWVIAQATTRQELGVSRTLEWKDIALALAGMVTYFILTAVMLLLAREIIPWFDIEQTQEIGLDFLLPGLQVALAFTLLVVIAPIVEELLFRGYLYGKLRGRGVPFWLTALVVSVLFGIAHLQWNVGIDTFALSLVMCATREITGSVWPSVLMHMMKNGIAFYFLFINPQALQGITG